MEETIVYAHENYVIRLHFLESGEAVPSITCTKCSLTSYNDSDIREKFCAQCGRFHEDEWRRRDPIRRRNDER